MASTRDSSNILKDLDLSEKLTKDAALLEKQNEELRKLLESSKSSQQPTKNNLNQKQYETSKMKNDELQDRLNKTVNMLNWYRVAFTSLKEKSVALELSNQELSKTNINVSQQHNLTECANNCKLLEKQRGILEIQNTTLEETLHRKMEELFDTKSNLVKSEENINTLKKERDVLETSIADLRKTLEIAQLELKSVKESSEKRKEKYKTLKEQYEALQASNTETKEELAREIVSRKLLVSDLKKKKAEIKKYEDDKTFKEYDLEDNTINNSERRFQFYKPVGIIQKINKDVETLYKNCIIERDKFAEEMKSHNRSSCSKMLEELKFEYDKLEEKLNKDDITITKQDFVKKMLKYKNLCTQNDLKWKDIIRQVYNMPTQLDEIKDKMKSKEFRDFSAVETILNELNDHLDTLKTNTLKNDFDVENHLFSDLVNTGMQEISYRRNLLCTTDEAAANVSARVFRQNDQERKILNNDKPIGLKRWDSLFSMSSIPECDESDRSIILFNLPESASQDEDSQMVATFLSPHKLKLEEYKMYRLGKIKPEGRGRPIVISFQNLDIFNRVLYYEEGGRHFNGCKVSVAKYVLKKAKTTRNYHNV